MASYSSRWIDPQGNTQYFHALAKTTYLSDGKDVEAALDKKATMAGSWVAPPTSYISGVSREHDIDPIRYYLQGNIMVIGGAFIISAATLESFTTVAEVTLPFSLNAPLLINCTGVIRGATGAYQDHMRAFRIQTDDDVTFPTNKMQLVVTRPISDGYQAPNGDEEAYSFIISGIGAVI